MLRVEERPICRMPTFEVGVDVGLVAVLGRFLVIVLVHLVPSHLVLETGFRVPTLHLLPHVSKSAEMP